MVKEKNNRRMAFMLLFPHFWVEEMVLHGTGRSLIRSLYHCCGCKQELQLQTSSHIKKIIHRFRKLLFALYIELVGRNDTFHQGVCYLILVILF